MPDHVAEKDWIDQTIPCRSRSRAAIASSWQRGLRYKNPEHERYPHGTPEVSACDDVELFYNPRSPSEVIDHSAAKGYDIRTLDDAFERLVPYRAVHGNQVLHGNLFGSNNIQKGVKNFDGSNGVAGRFERRFMESPFSKKFADAIPLGDPAHGIWVTRRGNTVACKLGTYDKAKVRGRATVWEMCKCPWDSTSIDLAGVMYDAKYSMPACIENYSDLKDLSIVDHQMSDVANLARAPWIERLDLSGNKLRDIPTFVLSSMDRLKKMAISAGQDSVTGISTGNFGDMKSLESIDISGMHVDTGKWMADLPNLKRIDASGSNLCVVPATSENPALKELVLNGATCDTDGNDIATWKNLDHLEVENTSLEHADAIGSLKKMKVLDLSRNEQVWKSRGIIGGMTKLKNLRLHDVGLPDIDFVKDLAGLEVLDISDSGVSDFTPIAGLKKLKRLNACASMISETKKNGDDESIAAIGNVEDVDLRLNDVGFSDLEMFPGTRKVAINVPSEELKCREDGVYPMSRCDLPRNKSLPTPLEWIRRNKNHDLLRYEIEGMARRYEADDARSDKPPKTKREYIDAAIEWAADDYADVYDRVCTFLTRLMNEKNPVIYREMKIEDADEFIRQLRENGGRTLRRGGLEGIGTSWTWDEGSASAIWGEDEPCTVLIRARVQDVDDIDFDLTLDLALVYVGFDENEVKMTKDSAVIVDRITVVRSSGCKQEGKTYAGLGIVAYT